MKKIMTFMAVAVAVIAVAFGVYVENYYRADDSVAEYLTSNDGVKVAQTDYGWFLDGPSEEDALVFYPGAKVEEKAYIPLLYRFAEEGKEFAPGQYFEHVIEGGNHAQFGNYGEQKGDGKALISEEEQQAETVRFVMEVK